MSFAWLYLCVCLSFALELKCPHESQWAIRAKILCGGTSSYFCLWDGNAKEYIEGCKKADFTRSGERYEWFANFDSKYCQKDVYQPYLHWTNESTGCIFKKSLCTKEGQVVYNITDTKRDTKCTCDYTKGYDFITKPNNPCYCIPAEEDCSCYLNPCLKPDLMSDPRCTEMIHIGYKDNCLPIKNNSNDEQKQPMIFNINQTDHTLSVPDRQNSPAVMFLICSLISVVAYFTKDFEQKTNCLAVGEPVTFFCEVLEDNTTAKWLLNGDKIEQSPRVRLQTTGRQHKLSINNVVVSDSGEYTVIVNNRKRKTKLKVKDTEIIRHTIQTKTETRYYIRVMIVGKNGVGKSCLLRRLLNEKIDEVKSTDGIDISTHSCKYRRSDKTWIFNKGKYKVSMKLNQNLDPKYGDTNSAEYQTLKTNLENELTTLYQKSEVRNDFQKVSVTGISQLRIQFTCIVTLTPNTEETQDSVQQVTKQRLNEEKSKPVTTLTLLKTADEKTVVVNLGKYEVSMKLNQNWDPKYGDTNSAEYKTLKTNLENELTTLYQNSAVQNDFKSVSVTAISQLSIQFTCIVTLNQDTQQNQDSVQRVTKERLTEEKSKSLTTLTLLKTADEKTVVVNLDHDPKREYAMRIKRARREENDDVDNDKAIPTNSQNFLEESEQERSDVMSQKQQAKHAESNKSVTVEEAKHAESNKSVTVEEAKHAESNKSVTVEEAKHAKSNKPLTADVKRDESNRSLTAEDNPSSQSSKTFELEQNSEYHQHDTYRKEQQTPTESVELKKKLSTALTEKVTKEIDDFLLHIEEYEENEICVEIRFWDFAGEKDYYGTHHIFLDRNAVYLLVSDCSEDIKKAKPCETSDSIGECIDFWFDTIHNCAEVQETTTKQFDPPIIAVCTGRDLLEGEVKEIEKQEDDYRRKLTDLIQYENKRKHLRDICFVSNTHPSDAEFSLLRKLILKYGETLQSYKEDLPLKWIRLEQSLEVLRDSGIPFVSRNDIIDLSVKCDFQAKKREQEVESFLNHQHKIGNIMYYSDIEDFVILRQQWLADAFKCLVSNKIDNSIKVSDEWKRLEKTGIIEKSFISKLFEKKLNLNNETIQENMITVLNKFGIIGINEEDHNLYYMPYMIKSDPTSLSDITNTFGVLKEEQKSPWLCLEFDFLPFAYFTHVMLHFIGNYTMCFDTKLRKQSIYHGVGVFFVDQEQVKNKVNKLILLFCKNTIAIQVWHFRDPVQKTRYNDILQEIETVIYQLKEKYKAANLRYSVKLKCSEGDINSPIVRVSHRDLPDKSEDGEYFCKDHNTYHDAIQLFNTWFSENPHAYMDRTKQVHVLELRYLGVETTEDFKEFMQKGSYKRYWNSVCLVGNHNVGKTTLAKILVGDSIPELRASTNGIELYKGLAGMDIQKRKWIYLPKGNATRKVLTMMLMSLKKQREKEGAKEGRYNREIVPIDILDFGGHKDYLMINQLFLNSCGIFVLMFNGSKDIHKNMPELTFLPGHYGKSSIAVYLRSWVNSILTYCHRTKNHFPRILFVATHKDLIPKAFLEEQREKLIQSIDDLFRDHPKLGHLEYKSLLFINAIDHADEEIEKLRQVLMDRAFEHPRWGEEMPTAWIPLELELAQEVENGSNIISMKQIKALNDKNESFKLTEKQLVSFLKIQHALGNVKYFDDVNLRDLIVINPVYMIEILRSIITDKQFWPKGEQFVEAHKKLRWHGIIEKSMIIEIWKQEEFCHILPHKDYVLGILVHLDVIVAQRTGVDSHLKSISDIRFFLVPCMITNPDQTDYMAKACTNDTSIVLAYTFVDDVIPPALSYRFLGSCLTMWDLKDYKGQTMIFSDLAVVEVGHKHDVAVQVMDKRVVVYLVHSSSKDKIDPTLASSIQECLTSTIDRISEFYSSLAEGGSKSTNAQKPFRIQYGVFCESPICFVDPCKLPSSLNVSLKCRQHRKNHDIKELHYWYAEKTPLENCPDECTGPGLLEKEHRPSDKHLRRLSSAINTEKCHDLAILLEIKQHEWDTLRDQYNVNDQKFMALWKWKQSDRKACFDHLKVALTDCECDEHYLCQVLRDIDISDIERDLFGEDFDTVPSDEILRDVSNCIGNSSLQLGIELGLDVPELQNILTEHRLKPLEQTREILFRWSRCKHIDNTLRTLVKALKRIRRSSCLYDIF